MNHLRIETNQDFSPYIQELENLKHLEIKQEPLRDIPVWFSRFSYMKQLIITSKNLNLSYDFWKEKGFGRFQLEVNSNCSFPVFTKELNQLTHLWIEIENLGSWPHDIIDILKNQRKPRIYTNSEIDMSLEEYLQTPDVDYSIIKVRYDCPILESLRENIIK